MNLEQTILLIKNCTRRYYSFTAKPPAEGALPPYKENPVSTRMVQTAFGGWWGYTTWSDGATTKKFRGYDTRLNPAWREAYDAHWAAQWDARDAIRAELPPMDGETFRLFQNETAEQLLHRYHSNNSRRDSLVIAAIQKLASK